MKKKIKNLFSLILLFLFIILKNNVILADQIENYIEPEEQSDFDYDKSKRRSSETQIFVKNQMPKLKLMITDLFQYSPLKLMTVKLLEK